MIDHQDAYQSAVAGACYQYERYILATWECRRYPNRRIHDKKCDAYALYCFDVFRRNAYWHAPSQWRLDSARPDELVKKGRCDDNCVFNGASYTPISHIYVTAENELGWIYKAAHIKAYFVELFFVH